MSQNDILQEILEDTNYRLDLFTLEEIAALAARVTFREVHGKQKPYIECILRGKDIILTPEEVIRQLYAAHLMDKYQYDKRRLRFEHPIHFGREVKRADIVIMDKDRPDVEYIIVELKKPNLLDGKKQLKSYCNATGAPMAIWTNGSQIAYYQRKDPNYFEPIPNIPDAYHKLSDILSESFTWRDLVITDAQQRNRSLKDRIQEMEDEVLANAGVDVFEEVFKLIFTKLYDELLSRHDKDFLDRYYLPSKLNEDDLGNLDAVVSTLNAMDKRAYQGFRDLEFRNSGQTDAELKEKIQQLFYKACDQWPGVFPERSTFELTPSHLSICVASLEPFKLFNSNLQVIDEAFEYLVNKSAKGEKGQYFTPRYVIDMCVKMLNPKPGEYMIDPAAGSCGFPVHTMFWITGRLFSNAEIPPEEKDNVLRIFGIDFDKKVVRVARALNLIAGDGEANVLHLNALDYERWDEVVTTSEWRDTYGAGFRRLERLRADDDYRDFLFDVLMANPPFAGDIKEPRIIHRYDLGFKDDGKTYSKLGRDILFIERNLDFLKSGGRMAIVLPQGRLNNSTDRRIRNFIAERCRILAVVGLHPNTFKPHAGTKTSVLFVQKWDDELCPRRDDYPIFFAVSEKGGKDSSGEYEYAPGGNGTHRLDKYGHYVVNHDLHNHGGELSDGIAEAFIEFAKREGLSFWKE
jgi:type I restriction enzyme M protein